MEQFNISEQRANDFKIHNCNQKQIALIYHCKDLDGLTSGHLLREYYETIFSNTVTMIPYNYESEGVDFIDNQLEFIMNFDMIIFADVTPSIEWLEFYIKNQKINTKLVIVDHHTKMVKDLMQVVHLNDDYMTNNVYSDFMTHVRTIDEPYLRDKYVNNFSYAKDLGKEIFFFISLKDYGKEMTSAAMIAYYMYHYFLCVTNQLTVNDRNYLVAMLEYVTLVAEYDVWNFNLPNYNQQSKEEILHFQYGFKTSTEMLFEDNDYDGLLSWVNEVLSTNYQSVNKLLSLQQVIDSGKEVFVKRESELTKNQNWQVVYGEDEKENDKYSGCKFVIIYGEYPDYISQEWFKRNISDLDAMIYVRFDNEKEIAKLSVRQGSNQDFDCIEFIQHLTFGNGGGHFAATGGATDDFNKMLYLNFK